MNHQGDDVVTPSHRSGAVLEDGGAALTSTKLARPLLPPGFVPRPRVDALLDAGTRGPLTVVSAGAGWGKTLATAAWAASMPSPDPVAWVSLDASDNQPRAFWSSVVEALRTAILPEPDNPLARLVPEPSTHQEFLRRLVAGLSRLSHPVVLVLDDVHLVDDEIVLADLAALLRTPVPQLRLVLLTRADPMLPLHRLRVAGRLVEVRAADLALTVADAATLLRNDGVRLEPGDAELVVDRTEGWPVGVRLAAMFLARDAPGHRPADFGGDDHAVVEYLAEEVLLRHPPDVQRFLLQTSVADRVCASLAEELTGERGGQRHLEELAASNAFVVELGHGRTWFRYHALLRQMLRHRLTVLHPGAVPSLHRRAAAWYGRQGQPLEALRHAADAEDWPLLGRILADQALPLALSAEREAVDEVLARIPAPSLLETPELGLAAATRVLLTERFAELQPHLSRVARQLAAAPPDSSPSVRVALLLFHLALARGMGDNEALIANASRVLAMLDAGGAPFPAAGPYRTIAEVNLGTGLLWAGRVAEGERHLADGLAGAGGVLDAARINTYSQLALAAAVRGRLGEAEERATGAIQLAQDHGWSPIAQEANAHLALSIVHLLRYDLDEALGVLASGRAAAAREPAPRCAMTLFQIRLDAASGRVDAARTQLARLHRELGAWQPPRLLARWLRVTAAEVDLAAGDAAAALGHLPGDEHDPDDELVAERLLRARALLDLADPNGADAVLAALPAAGLGERPDVERWVLTALVADRLREDRRAGEALRLALLHAAPEGVRLPFVAWGRDQMPRLLARARMLHPEVRQFVAELEGLLPGTTMQPETAASQAVLLTDRELSVLEYLPTMLTYPEIAAQLFVSVNTVKSHLRHLYAKLEVVNRRQAVTRARELGLLEG